MREARREEQQRTARRDALGLSKRIQLLPETKMDRLRASAVEFGGGVKSNWRKKRKSIKAEGIFGGTNKKRR